MPPLIALTAGDQLVTVGGDATTEATLLHHLTQSSPGTNGYFLAFTICLPEADVIHKPVCMGIKSLLTFIDAPHLDSVFYKPLHNKRSFF